MYVDIKCQPPTRPLNSSSIVGESVIGTTANIHCVTNWKWSDETIAPKSGMCVLNADSFTASWNITGGFYCKGCLPSPFENID